MNNLHLLDKIARIIFSIFLLYLSGLQINLYSVLAILLLGTITVGYCPLYGLFNINDALAKKNKYINQLPKNNPEPVFIFSDKGKLIYQNESSKIILPNIKSLDAICTSNSSEIIEQEQKLTISHEYDSKTYIIEIIGVKKESYILAYGFNATDIENSRKELKKQIVTDYLTHLGNGSKVINDFVDHSNKREVFIVLDIVKFNEINSTFGAIKANNVLVAFAKTLQTLKKDFPNIHDFYRLRANTFALLVLFDDIKGKDYKTEITTISDKIFSIFDKNKLQVDDIHVNINLRMGIACNNNFAITPETRMTLLRDAEMALSEAKNKSLKILNFETISDVKEKYKENLQWANKLHDILNNDSNAKFYTYFQAIYNLKAKKIEKFEALIRIKEGDKVISPFFFLDVAAQTNILPKITQHVLKESCEQFKNTPYEFSINISAQDFLEKDFVNNLQNQIEKYNIKPNSIVLEILEDEDMYQYTDMISDLKQRGFKIAIDDFGTGYSNFKKLQQLNADYIKIDGSLVKNIASNPKDLSIIISICTYAKTIGAKTIAEYVANKEIFDLLKQTDVDYVQGYYISEPKPTIEVSFNDK